MNEKRLLIVLGSMGRGGAERVISLISDDFCKRGWKVYIALLLFNKVEYVLNENVTVINLSGEGQSRTKRLPGWILGIRKLVKDIKPDSILSFAARINIITQIACLGLGQRIVVSERNDPYMDGRSKVVDLFTGLLYPKAKAVVFQTRRAESYFSKIKLKNAVIIPNPISVQCMASDVKHEKIVAVGRLTKQKNHKMLVDAFESIHKVYPECELYIYGEGELRDDLQLQIDELHISDAVYLKGNVLNVHEQIADATMFVLSSDYEGLSNALLEAMMMGIPCISTNCAGAEEYIVTEESGIIIPIGDKNALIKAMFSYLNDSHLREKCRLGAMEVAKNVESDVILEKWYSILN